jgi:hypothetical protein
MYWRHRGYGLFLIGRFGLRAKNNGVNAHFGQ